MTQQPPAGLDLRGAVDLSALSRPAASASAASPAGSGGPGAAVVVDATEDTFNDIVQQSLTVPVVIDLWAEWCGPCKQLSPVLERVAVDYGGRFLLVKVDVDANPRLAQAFQAQSIPMVVALLKGQPVPMFTGAVPEPQVRQVVDELLKVAAQNGVTGTLAATESEGEAEQGAEPELPPLHAAAADAIESGNYDKAVSAFQQAIEENPADSYAKAGLAQASLLQRVTAVPPAVQAGIRQTAAAEPGNVEAQLAAADLDAYGGHVDDAFGRLIELIRRTAGEERAAVRTRLLELFELAGPDDPRVAKARTALASALF